VDPRMNYISSSMIITFMTRGSTLLANLKTWALLIAKEDNYVLNNFESIMVEFSEKFRMNAPWVLNQLLLVPFHPLIPCGIVIKMKASKQQYSLRTLRIVRKKLDII